MKAFLLNFAESAIPFTVTPVKYLLYLGLAFAGMQILGVSYFYLLNNNIVNFIGNNVICQPLDLLYNLVYFSTNLIANIPIIRSIPAINLLFKSVYIINPILKSIFYVFKAPFSIPAQVSAIILAPLSLYGGYKFYEGEGKFSKSIYNTLKPFKKNEIIGHAVRRLKKFSKSKNIEEYIINRIKNYKNKSITPLFTSALISGSAFYFSTLFGAPLLLAGISSIGLYSVIRSSSIIKAINNYINEQMPDNNDTAILSKEIVTISSVIAPFTVLNSFNILPILKSNIYVSFNNFISNTATLGNIIQKAFPFLSLKFEKIILTTEKLGNIFKTLYPLFSLVKSYFKADESRGVFHQFFNSQFESFCTFFVSSLALSIVIPVLASSSIAPILTSILAISTSMTIQTSIIGSAALVCSYINGADFSKIYDDTKDFIMKKPFTLFTTIFGEEIGFKRSIGRIIIDEWANFGGFVTGAFLGGYFPVSRGLIRNYTPNIYSYIINSPGFIESASKILPMFIGGTIGAFINKKVTDSYFDSEDKKRKQKEEDPKKQPPGTHPKDIPVPIATEKSGFNNNVRSNLKSSLSL